MSNQSKIGLLGADKFILALEYHDRHEGSSGNTCRYILELDEAFDDKAFASAIQKNEIAQWLGRFVLTGKLNNSNFWKQADANAISITHLDSDEVLPKALMEIRQNCYTAPLFYFHILHRSNGSKSLIFSWHHLIMDGYGATLFLRNLIEPQSIQDSEKVKSPLKFGIFREMVKAKKYISKSAKGDIGTIESNYQSSVEQCYKIISFSQEETLRIDKLGRDQGAKYGQGAFLLSCTANSVGKYLANKGNSSKDFWIPIPQDSRKRGSKWPLLGNHLSFLFYRINKELIDDIPGNIASLNTQMMDQIKMGIPSGYSHLMNYLRHIPSPLYTRLIKGPNGKSLSSFLFTVAAEHPKELSEFFGSKITNAITMPPNVYPPGLTFAFNRFDGKLQVVILSYKHLMNQQQFEVMETSLREKLLG